MGGVPFAAPSHAAVSTPVGPPFDSADHAVDCHPLDGACAGTTSADAQTGDIDLDLSIAAPPGGLESDAFGFVHGAFAATAVVDQAAALVVRAHFRIDDAEVGLVGPGSTDWGSASLWTYLSVSHDSCEKCRAFDYELVAWAFEDEYAEVDAEHVFVEVRIVNPAGDVPAGALDLIGVLTGDAWLEAGDTGTMVARADAALTGFEVVTFDATPVRSVTKPYVGPPGDVAYLGLTGPNCTRTGDAVGGACYRVEPGDALARFQVADDHPMGPVGASWHFYDEDDVLLGQGQFCGSSRNVWVPDGTTQVAVLTQTTSGNLHCTRPTAPATTGTVTAEFFG